MSQVSNPHIREVKREVFRFTPNSEILGFTNSQKINHKIVLSFYGKKIDLPCKFVHEDNFIEVLKDVAQISSASHEVIEAYRLEITHPLGKMFCRFDVPKKLTASQMTADAFSIAELNVKAKREFEDYLINRKQYDLEFSQMDLSHRQARLGRKYEYINKGIDIALGFASTGVSAVTGPRIYKNWKASEIKKFTEKRQKLLEKNDYAGLIKHERKGIKKDMPFGVQQSIIATGLGTYSGISRLASGIAGLVHVSEKAALQEEGFNLDIQEKALRSYEIDLGFEREKDEQLFTMRRIFASENYNEVTDRQRQQVLDKLENPALTDEIYLEVWTTSGEQQEYVDKYHDKYGVDCRVVKNEIAIRDDMRKGIYCIEDVEISNLVNRVDFEYLKARLTGGIKFIEWEEFKGEKEFHPIDERVKELEDEIIVLKRQKKQADELNAETLKELRESNNTLHNQVGVSAERYHELSENYKKKEAELQTQTNLATLYKNEADHFKQDLLKKDSEHAREKEEHSNTKQQLDEKTKEFERQSIELQSIEKANDQLTEDLENLKHHRGEAEKLLQEALDLSRTQALKITELEKVDADNKRLLQEIKDLREESETCKREKQENSQTLLSQRDELLRIKKQIEEVTREKEATVALQNSTSQQLLRASTELEETKKSLEAVREIEKQKSQELEELKKQVKSTTPTGFFKDLLKANASDNKFNYVVVIQATDYDGYVVLKWYEEAFAFLPMKHKRYNEARIWCYDSYQLYTIGWRDGQEKNQTISSPYWAGYDYNFNNKLNKWLQVKQKILKLRDARGMASVYKQPVVFVENPYTIPYFYLISVPNPVKEDGVRTAHFELQLVNSNSLYWDSVKKRFTNLALQTGTSNKKINTYKDYCDVLGLTGRERVPLYPRIVADRGMDTITVEGPIVGVGGISG